MTVGKAGEIVEYLEEAFHFEEIEKNVLRGRRAFESMDMEQLGRCLLLSRELSASAEALTDLANRLGTAAHSIYGSAEDTGRGVIAGVAGLEPYIAYRQRIADRLAQEAEKADCAIREEDETDPRPGAAQD